MPITPVDPSQYKGQALISLTYDDGQRNDFDLALPIHVEFNMAAGFSIIAERAEDPKYKDRYMEPWQVTEASRQGVEIYSHSYTHHAHLPTLDDAALDMELKKSQEYLQGLLAGHQRKITSLAIPFSDADQRVLSAAGKYYASIRVKGNKTTPVMPAKGEDPIVYSYGLKKETTFDEVKALIDKAVQEKSWLTLMLHGIVAAPDPAQRFNDVDVPLLRQIIGYIKSLGPETLLPINLSDIHAIRAHHSGILQPPPTGDEAVSSIVSGAVSSTDGGAVCSIDGGAVSPASTEGMGAASEKSGLRRALDSLVSVSHASFDALTGKHHTPHETPDAEKSTISAAPAGLRRPESP